MRWSHVVPVHELRPGLERCLRSITVGQGHSPDREVIVVDSTGEPGKIADVLGSLVLAVRHLDVGPCDDKAINWNAGIDAATGDLVHLLPDDDWIAPTFCREVERAAEECPEASLFGVGYENVAADGRVRFCQVYNWTYGMKALDLTTGNFFHPGAVVCRRAVYDEFRYRSVGFLDWDFLLIASERFAWKLIPQVLHFKQETGGMTTYDRKLVEAMIEWHEERIGRRMDEARRRYL